MIEPKNKKNLKKNFKTRKKKVWFDKLWFSCIIIIIIIIIIQIVFELTKIENFMDKNLNEFYFLFVSNKLIFILQVPVLYF